MTPEEKRRIATTLVQQMSEKQKEKLKEFIFALKDTSQSQGPAEVCHQEVPKSDQ